MKTSVLSPLPLLLTLSASALAGSGAPGGPAIFKANCASCHGAAGKGGIGPALGDSATWSSAVFSRSLLRGLNDHGEAFKAPMPTLRQGGLCRSAQGGPHASADAGAASLPEDPQVTRNPVTNAAGD